MLELAYIGASDRAGIVDDLAGLYAVIFGADLPPQALDELQERPNLLAGVAYLEGKPAGFKAGYTLPEAPDVLYSWAGGTDPAYRRCGIGWTLMLDQHDRAAALGLTAVETKCRPKWAAMVALNYRAGFTLLREYVGQSCGTTKYHFRKELQEPGASQLRKLLDQSASIPPRRAVA